MYNQLYEDKYTNYIEPKYGNKRNIHTDEVLTKNIYNSHTYSINCKERVNMTLVKEND